MVIALVAAALVAGGLLGALLNRRRPTRHSPVHRGVDSADPTVQAGWTNLHGH